MKSHCESLNNNHRIMESTLMRWFGLEMYDECGVMDKHYVIYRLAIGDADAIALLIEIYLQFHWCGHSVQVP